VQLAALVCGEQRANTRITIADGQLCMHSRSRTGQVTDAMPIARHHPEVTISLRPEPLERARDCNRMLVTSRGVIVMTKADSDAVYLVCGNIEE
jgi:hypothetical protein